MRLDVNVDAYVPADYIPYEAAKIDVHRRVAGAREVADLAALRDELEDRFGPVPAPLQNLISLQQARIKLGQAGARAVRIDKQGRMAVTPIDLDEVRQQRLRERAARGALRAGPRAGLADRARRPATSASPRSSARPTSLLAVTRAAA